MVGVRYQQDYPERAEITSYHCNRFIMRNLKTEGKAIDRLSVPASDREFIPTLGFEVEKRSITGKNLNSPLWWKHESDPSCGHESVTHALPALRAGLWRDKILSLINESSDLLDAETSNYCGGHVTMTCPGRDREMAYDSLRRYIHMVYAIWPERLSNNFCSDNPELDVTRMPRKYSAVKYRDYAGEGRSLVEIRVPSGVKNTSDMVARYKFFTQFAYWVENETPVDDCHRWMLQNFQSVILPMVTEPVAWLGVSPAKFKAKLLTPCREGVRWLQNRHSVRPVGWDEIELGDIREILR
jgi:hypothetical protein